MAANTPGLSRRAAEANDREAQTRRSQGSGVRDFVDAVEAADEFVDGGFVGLDLAFEVFALVVAERRRLESLLGLDDLTDSFADAVRVVTRPGGRYATLRPSARTCQDPDCGAVGC